jgi:O-antigen ligase
MSVSIAISETALWLAGVVWSVNWLRSELTRDGYVPEPQRGPAGDVFALVGTPLMAFWGISVISALASRAPVESMWELRDVFLFVAPPVTYLAYQHPRMRNLGVRVFGAGVLAAILIGLAGTLLAMQRGEMPGTYRPDGTLGHYMTYAGALMLAIPVLLTVQGGKSWLWHRLVALGAFVLLGLTMTRSGWIGCAVGLAVWALSRFVRGRSAETRRPGRRWAGYVTILCIAVIIALIVLLSLAGPETLFARGASVFALDNPTNLDRLAMAATGLRIIGAHPWLGIGPGLMERVYPAWRVDWAVQESNPHLHNNILHVAAERGLLALAAWVWLMAAICVGAWRVLRYAGPFGEGGPEARAALAALAAFLTMGLFEYNFGDSEVMMILLFIVTLPFAASSGIAHARGRGEDLGET